MAKKQSLFGSNLYLQRKCFMLFRRKIKYSMKYRALTDTSPLVIHKGGWPFVNVIMEGGQGSVNKLQTRGEGGSKIFDFMLAFIYTRPQAVLEKNSPLFNRLPQMIQARSFTSSVFQELQQSRAKNICQPCSSFVHEELLIER